MNTSIPDALVFLRAWVFNPLRIAAVAPSGKSLAELITCEISGDTGPVIELGPGTGSFTQALLERGVNEKDLMLFELDTDFVSLLRARFPEARIVPGCATRLNRRSYYENGEKAGAAVSGLPFLSMPPRRIMTILKGTFDHMKPDGAFYQFTYSSRCSIPPSMLERLGLEAVRIGGTFRNIPPASVYRITRISGADTN